jgi:hypothetical protein
MYSPELLSAVAVLDKDQPGWWRKIDLENFNLHSDRCVLGQVYELRGIHTIFDKAAALGLCCLTFCPDWSVDRQQDDSEVQWRSLIEARQSADRIGETLSIPELESEAVEGYERVLV